MGTLACFLILQTGAQIMCMWIAAKKFFCSISASIFFIVDSLLWLLNHASLCLKVNCTTTLWTSWSQLSFVLYNSLFIKVLVHMIVQSLQSIVEKIWDILLHNSLSFYIHDCGPTRYMIECKCNHHTMQKMSLGL